MKHTQPELLEACKEALKDLKFLKGYIPRHRKIIAQLERVIAKSESKKIRDNKVKELNVQKHMIGNSHSAVNSIAVLDEIKPL